MKWTQARQAHFEYFAEHLKGDGTKKLLDLGAGPVQFRDLFFKYDYFGVDIGHFEFVDLVTDLRNPIPLPAGSYDIITLSNCLEHIPNPQDLLKECRRLLKPGGMIIGTVPFLIRPHQEPYDFYRYTNHGLLYLLKDFEEVEVENIGSASYIYKEIQDKYFEILLGQQKSLFLILFTKLTLWQRRFLRKLEPSDELPQSYGFRGYKVDK